jgi:DNA polymerase
VSSITARAELDSLAERVRACHLCSLLACRKNAVPGEGPAHAELLFIGEAPGADEDETGRPFVGRAGQLLTKMIEAIKLRREDVFIANVLKCRPPSNRPPQPDEIANCFPFLSRQIALLRPKIICTLGLHASQTVLASKASMGQLRGQVFDFGSSGARVVPTYHPAYLLRSPGEKVKAWEDLKRIAALLGRPV